MTEPTATYTTTDVVAALNRAADDIIEAVEPGDEGLRDALNLMVNATADYLAGTASSLDDVAEANYDANLEEILGWIEAGIH